MHFTLEEDLTFVQAKKKYPETIDINSFSTKTHSFILVFIILNDRVN